MADQTDKLVIGHDFDLVCTTCRYRGGHSPACPRKDEPWPTITLSNTPSQGEAVAWLHTMTYETGETNARLSFSEANPFGEPGRDYSEEYTVTSEPLFTALTAAPDKGVGG